MWQWQWARSSNQLLSSLYPVPREATLTCGTDSTPMDGTACVGGPGTDQQHVCGMCGILYDMSFPLGATAFPAL